MSELRVLAGLQVVRFVPKASECGVGCTPNGHVLRFAHNSGNCKEKVERQRIF